VASPSVQQHVAVLHTKAEKLDTLMDFLAEVRAAEGEPQAASSDRRRLQQPHPRVLVFTNTKDACEHLAWALQEE